MTENERIRQLRKQKSMTLDEMGARIGIQKSGLSKIERGKSAVTDRTRKALCLAFGVRENWLRTGDGEPYAAFQGESLSGELADSGLSAEEYVIMSQFAALPRYDREKTIEFGTAIAESINRGEPVLQAALRDWTQEM